MKSTLRTLTLTLTLFAFVRLGGVAFAQEAAKEAAAKATTVEKVLGANPEPDGNAYRIDLLLTDGTPVAYEIPPSEASKIANGLSKPAIAGGQNKQVATLVYGMTIEVDSKGEAVILFPRGRYGGLEPLAIPIGGANLLVKALQTKIVEAKATAVKLQKQQKKP